MDERLVFRAGLTRVALALLAVALLPIIYPRMAAHRWLLAAYLAFTLVEQFLIAQRIGGTTRSFVAGLVDLGILTFIVHRTGSFATMLVALYSFSATVNALVVGLRVGLAQAVIGTAAYAFIVVAERVGWLPHAADAPSWASVRPPGALALVAGCSLVSLQLTLPTVVVGLLLRAVRRRERALVDARDRLEELSVRDPLTQLYNRRHLLARLEEEMARARRGRPFAIAMIDLDRFKRINDAAGHERGDVLLCDVARALSATTRATDVPGRYGGDEFLVILPDSDQPSATAVGERLTASVREVGSRFDAACPITASVGIALIRPEDTVRELVRRADENAYRAKQEGGDRVVGP